MAVIMSKLRIKEANSTLISDKTLASLGKMALSFIGLHLQDLQEKQKSRILYQYLEFSVIIHFVIVSVNNFYVLFPHYFQKYFYY